MTSDITLKTLLMDGAPAILAHLGGTADMAPAPAEVPAVVFRRVDLLGTLPDQRMLHTEVPPRCGLRGAGRIIEDRTPARPICPPSPQIRPQPCPNPKCSLSG